MSCINRTNLGSLTISAIKPYQDGIVQAAGGNGTLTGTPFFCGIYSVYVRFGLNVSIAGIA